MDSTALSRTRLQQISQQLESKTPKAIEDALDDLVRFLLASEDDKVCCCIAWIPFPIHTHRTHSRR